MGLRERASSSMSSSVVSCEERGGARQDAGQGRIHLGGGDARERERRVVMKRELPPERERKREETRRSSAPAPAAKRAFLTSEIRSRMSYVPSRQLYEDIPVARSEASLTVGTSAA